MRFIIAFFIFCFYHSSVSAQKVIYGSNPATGKYYDIRGIKVYCEVYGKGMPLLLLHGNGGNIRAFEQNIPYFAAKYKVIAVDSRAQGKSADPKDSLSFEMMADDEAALLEAMHIDSAYVLGWSDGGIVALAMAMRHPGKVIKLAATGANLTPDSLAFQPGSWQEGTKIYEKHKENPNATAAEKTEWKMFLLDYKEPNIPFDALSVIKCPSLIICGDHDVIAVEHTVKIFQHIPQGRLWVVPNSGHATLMEHRDDFNRVVNAFFQEKVKK